MAQPRPIRVREPDAAPRPISISASKVDASDWPAQAADSIERVVLSVRDKTTGPAITAARWLVAGLFLILAGTMAAILLVVAGVRALDAYLPSSVFGEDHVWAAHALIGLPPFAGGLLLLRKRSQADGR
jgi:hypothetical protein